LSRQEEKHLFLRYNYARWRTIGAVEAFRTQPTRAGAAALALWYGRVKDTRDRLVEANLALVLSLARRTRGRMVDFDELISEGNVALLRAINAFDAARGFKFSTYACPAIVKSFSRLLSKTGRARAVCPVQYDPAMERSTHQETSRDQTRLDTVTALLRILVKNRAQLTDIEQRIIDTRFALHREPDQPTMTLEEVGRVVGVTKERVRQIQNVALAKLRASLQKEAF